MNLLAPDLIELSGALAETASDLRVASETAYHYDLLGAQLSGDALGTLATARAAAERAIAVIDTFAASHAAPEIDTRRKPS